MYPFQGKGGLALAFIPRVALRWPWAIIGIPFGENNFQIDAATYKYALQTLPGSFEILFTYFVKQIMK